MQGIEFIADWEGQTNASTPAIDSCDFLNLLIGLHKKLAVDIPEADYGKLNTLNEMIACLSARTK